MAHSLCIFVVLRKTCSSLFFSLSIRVLKIQHFVEGMMAGTLIHSSNSHSTYRFLNKLCAASQSFCVLVRTKTMPQSEQSTTHLHVLHFKNCFSLLFPDVPGTSEMVHSRITFSRVCSFMSLRSYHTAHCSNNSNSKISTTKISLLYFLKILSISIETHAW